MVRKCPVDRYHYVEDNLLMVHSCVRRYIKPKPQDYEDVYQEGCIGLIKAATNFDESRGFQFSTYAYPMIIGEIRRYLRDQSSTIRYNRNMLHLYAEVQRLKSLELSNDEIIKELNIGSCLYFDVLNMYNVSSYDQSINEDTGESFLSFIGYDDPGFEEINSGVNLEKSLESVVNKLGEKYKGIYEEYIYGLIYGEKIHQDYFSKKYGLSQAQVSRVIRKLNKIYVILLEGGQIETMSSPAAWRKTNAG